MSEVVAFKSGKDLGEEPSLDDDDERVTCIDCGARATDQHAYELGWQFAPSLCPSCLRWVVTSDDPCCHGRSS
jgi:hypothetical protein